ncbi:MAG TPA: hypothetical protein VLA54_13105 [Acidimicrobiia bacterium]|nr:hypothetical protein [Acidimicrobiia bacterium]
MPPPLPDRYRLEVRLGRDHDIEEWLATDLNLDRPVLIRILGPDASPKRRQEFLDTVTAAAAVIHPHLEPVYAAGEVAGGAYAVSEWGGGLTLQTRLNSGEVLDPGEFATNAPGLAGALAALHEKGLVHGAIDAGSIMYTVARPARLGGFGRPRRYLATPAGDVTDLVNVLERALTGYPPGGPPPSEVVDGLPRTLDEALAQARAGTLDASGLAVALETIPRPEPTATEEPSRRRAPWAAAALVLLAAGLIALGRVLAGDISVPVIPGPPVTGPTSTTVAPTPTTSAPADSRPPVAVVAAATYDPYGEGGENDGSIGAVVDGDPTTAWRTERYRDPVELLKPGVGLTVAVTGSPSQVALLGLSPGVVFQLSWSAERPPEPGGWEQIASGRVEGAPLTIQVPSRPGGNWLLWFTSLPPQPDGDHWTTVAEIRFS